MTQPLQIEPMTGTQVRTIRERLGFSQEKFARMLDMSLAGYAIWEQLKDQQVSVRATLAVQGLADRLKQAKAESQIERKTANKAKSLSGKGKR